MRRLNLADGFHRVAGDGLTGPGTHPDAQPYKMQTGCRTRYFTWAHVICGEIVFFLGLNLPDETPRGRFEAHRYMGYLKECLGFVSEDFIADLLDPPDEHVEWAEHFELLP